MMWRVGSHTIGQARCTTFRGRIYNESNIDGSFARTRQGSCPRTSGSGDNNLAPLDLKSPTFFDASYYKNLLDKKGLLHSDQVLYNGGSTDNLVEAYSKNPKAFADDFAAAMIKMGDISPLTGSSGEIRKNCRKANWSQWLNPNNKSLLCVSRVFFVFLFNIKRKCFFNKGMSIWRLCIGFCMSGLIVCQVY